KNISVKLEIEENITMKGDKPMVTQAIANLLDNAIKYTSKGGEITICLSVNENMVEFVVADNGVGIPENLYAKVKERFFRIEESRTSVGTGLGLSLVDAVAKLHHGELNFANNNPGLRAILTMSLNLN
ncbi:MAG: ATP-binding protein, partial [Pseudomonadota bacterium]